jgi:hypothetical protein
MSMQDELQAKLDELKGLLHHGPSLEPLWQGLIKAIGELEQGNNASLDNKLTNWETRIALIEDEAKKYFAVLAATVQQIRSDMDDVKVNQNAAADHLDKLSKYVGTLTNKVAAAQVGGPPAEFPKTEGMSTTAAEQAPVEQVPTPTEPAAPAAPEPAAPELTAVLADPPGPQPATVAAGPTNELLGA